jgi:hypothetical protein
MYGTFEALRVFQRARYRLWDERRVALGTGHKLFSICEVASRRNLSGQTPRQLSSDRFGGLSNSVAPILAIGTGFAIFSSQHYYSPDARSIGDCRDRGHAPQGFPEFLQGLFSHDQRAFPNFHSASQAANSNVNRSSTVGLKVVAMQIVPKRSGGRGLAAVDYGAVADREISGDDPADQGA